MTGQYEDPDETLMKEVEALLGVPDKPETLRHSLINLVAAWAIDHPGVRVDNAKVFQSQLRRLRESVFSERRGAVARLCRDMVMLLRDEGEGLDGARRGAAQAAVEQLIERYGYAEASVSDAVIALTRERFADLLP
jgi:hypothetical protein